MYKIVRIQKLMWKNIISSTKSQLYSVIYIYIYIYLALDNSFMTFNIKDGFENLASFQILYIECNCMVRCILFDRNGILQVVITQKDITVHLRIVD